MRLHLVLLTLSIAALGVGAGPASAATLWTTPAHTSRVAVGTPGTASGATFTLTAATNTINSCRSSDLGLTVSQNSGAGIVAEVTTGSLGGCSPFAWTLILPWTLTVSGTGSVSGTSTCWSAMVDNFGLNAGGFGTYTGNLTSGVTACQPTAVGSPLQLRFAVAKPSGTTWASDTTSQLAGTAAAWSLTS